MSQTDQLAHLIARQENRLIALEKQCQSLRIQLTEAMEQTFRHTKPGQAVVRECVKEIKKK